MARRGGTSQAARIDAKVRRSVCGVMCAIGTRPSASSSSLARSCSGARMRARTLSGCGRVWLRVGNAGSPPAEGKSRRWSVRCSRRTGTSGICRSPASVFVASRGIAQAAAGEVEMVGAEPAELADARAREDQRLDDDPPRYVVAVAGFGALVPELAAADLADEGVRDAE